MHDEKIPCSKISVFCLRKTEKQRTNKFQKGNCLPGHLTKTCMKEGVTLPLDVSVSVSSLQVMPCVKVF